MNRKMMIPALLVLTLCIQAEDPQAVSRRLLGNYQQMTKRNILVSPIPKQLEFYRNPVAVKQMILVLPENTDTGKLIAEEINSRLNELGEEKLPERRNVQPGKFNLIVDSGAFLKDLPPQGYRLIREKHGLRLAGKDRAGLLYAAVTARGLFGKSEKGVLFHAAEAADWPDFIFRQANAGERANYRELKRNDPELYFQESIPWMNHLFRHKINMAGGNTYTPYQDCFSPFRKTPEVPKPYLDSIRRLNSYMKTREIRQHYTVHMKLGTLQQNGNHPEVRNLTLIPWHNHYNSWGRPDLQKIAAEKLLRYAKAAGITQISLHPVDGGSITDPELWSTRDAISRKLYPNDTDRARADADQFAVYQEVFKDSGIDLVYIPYPYFGKTVTRSGVSELLGVKEDSPLVERYLQKTLQWGRDLHARLPKEIPVEIRESDRASMRAYMNMFPGRPGIIYLETHLLRPEHDDWPLLSPYLAAMQTFLPFANQIGRMNDPRFHEPFLPITAEYMWNAYAPYYAEYELPLKTDPGRLPFMAEYTCIATWGVELGKLAAPAFSSGLSLEYLLNPEIVERAQNIKDPLPVYRTARAKLDRAIKAFEQVRAKLDAAGGFASCGVGKLEERLFNQYQLMFHGTKIFADGRYYRLEIEKTIREGNFAQASELVREAKTALNGAQAAFERILRSRKPEEMLLLPAQVPKVHYSLDKSLHADAAKEIQEILALDAQKEKLFAAMNVPDWLKESLKHPLPCGKAAGAIVMDGIPDEATWSNTVPVEHFIQSSVFRLMKEPIAYRMLVDDENLYLSGVIERKNLQNYKESRSAGGESAQIFFPAKDGTLRQWIIAPNGNVLFHIWSVKAGAGKPDIRRGKSAAECKSAAAPRQWSFEIRIPVSELGGKPDRALFAYETMPEKGKQVSTYYATAFADGGSFFNPDLRRTLSATPEKINADCLRIYFRKPVERKDVLLSSGIGSEIQFQPVVECFRPVRNLRIYAEILDADGRIVGKSMVAKEEFVPASLNPAMRSVQTETIQKTFIIRLTAEYILDGKKCRQVMDFPVGSIRAETFAKLCEAPEGELPFAAYYPRRAELKQGGMEFDLWIGESVTQDRTLFHLGKINVRHPGTANHNSIRIYAYRRALGVSICDRRYQRRSLHAVFPLKKWCRVRIDWKAEKEKCALSVTIDGKTQRLLPEDPQNRTPYPHDFIEAESVQFNAMNTGYSPAYARMKNIRLNGKNLSIEELSAGTGAAVQKVFPASSRPAE